MKSKKVLYTEGAKRNLAMLLKCCFGTVATMHKRTQLPMSTCSEIWNEKREAGIGTLAVIKDNCKCYSLDHTFTNCYKKKHSTEFRSK